MPKGATGFNLFGIENYNYLKYSTPSNMPAEFIGHEYINPQYICLASEVVKWGNDNEDFLGINLDFAFEHNVGSHLFRVLDKTKEYAIIRVK